MPRIRPGPPCSVCGEPSKARNLCPTHHSRWLRHGHVDETRPKGWGKRSSHPLKDVWCHTLKVQAGRVERWNDFWAFIEDVGERPEKARLKRLDNSKPWGPDNAYWQPFMASVKDVGRSEWMRIYRKNNAEKHKGYDLKKKYGISLADYDHMLDAQNGNCAICGEKDGTFGRLVVDHCHNSKVVRGLLCSLCNRALGGFRHDQNLLKSAAEYLSWSQEMCDD